MKVSLGDIEHELTRYFHTLDEGRCLYTIALSRYAADDLSTEERKQFELHLKDCEECNLHLQRFDTLAAVWESGQETKRNSFIAWMNQSWARPWVVAAASLSGVLLLILLLVPGGPRITNENQEGLLRPKGSWQLYVAAERKGRTFLVVDGSVLQSGDRLGFFYSTENAGHMLIYYVEQSGSIVRLFPAMKAESASVAAGQKVRLPDGAVLSPAKGCEWILGLFSQHPIEDVRAKNAILRMIEQKQGCLLDPRQAGLSGVEFQLIQVDRE